MKKQLAICIGLMVAGVTAVPAAQAQPIYVRPDIVRPDFGPPGVASFEVAAIVRSAGLTPLTRPVRRGPNYVLLAADRRGRDLRVVVDPYVGDIVSARPVYASRAYGPYDPPPRLSPSEPVYGPGAHIAPPARGDDGGPRVIYAPRGNSEGNASAPRSNNEGNVTSPRNSAPNTRTASAPPVAQQPQTPLPRPRPSIAATQAPAEPAPAAPAAPQAAPAPAAVTGGARCQPARRDRKRAGTADHAAAGSAQALKIKAPRQSRGARHSNECRLSSLGPQAAFASTCLVELLPVPMRIWRGFIASGTSRTRSTCRRPFSRLAPLTST